MASRESSVNFQNLIRDLADMYPFAVSEVVVVELVANSLDAGATRILMDYDPTRRTLVVEDNGGGMTHEQFEEYHDFAAGLKRRGDGIGFAGVGAKISFNLADRVVTQTRSRDFSGGSDWRLESKRRLVWDEIPPSSLDHTGTRVEVLFREGAPLSFSKPEDLVALLRRHYLPLLDRTFLSLYAHLGYYCSDLRFIVCGTPLEPVDIRHVFELEMVEELRPTSGGKEIGYGIIGLAKSEYPVGPDLCGVLLCTRGKVIKADLFNQFPGALGARIFGLVELPNLVRFLTTSKTDFIRGRQTRREFERLYDPVRQAFKQWLAAHGLRPSETSHSDEVARLERELRRLAQAIPELAEFAGGHMERDIPQQSTAGNLSVSLHDGVAPTYPLGQGRAGDQPGPQDAGGDPGQALEREDASGTLRAKPISRRARRGPRVDFADRPDSFELGWVDGDVVVINRKHPAYTSVENNPQLRFLHNLYSIAVAVQRFLALEGDAQDLAFVDRMLAAWGRK